MNKNEESIKPKINHKIGDLVVINSYPEPGPITGDPLHVPPIMVVVGIEVENKKKKTHDNELGIVVGERVKYNLLWFDNKKSVFVEKIMYQKLLRNRDDNKIVRFKCEDDYQLGRKVSFVTSQIEISKEKQSISKTETLYKSEGKKNVKKKTTTITPLVTYSCPDLIITGARKNDKKEAFDDFGEKNKYYSKILIKVMWFNPNSQKYSEQELPQECLIKI